MSYVYSKIVIKTYILMVLVDTYVYIYVELPVKCTAF